MGRRFRVIVVTPSGWPKPTMDQAKANAQFRINGKDVLVFALAGRSFKDLEVTAEQLKEYPAPILFIQGGNETGFVKDSDAAVRALLGRGKVRIIEGADHMTTLIKPEFGSAIMGVPALRQAPIGRQSRRESRA